MTTSTTAPVSGPVTNLKAHPLDAYLVRFTPWQRVEHFLVMTVFTLLVVTGMPQKFSTAGFSAAVVQLFGGITPTRVVHRAAGFVFTFLMALHLGVVIWKTATKRFKLLTMLPGRRDYLDALQTLRYYVGLEKQHPRFDRFDYRQKFEYWGMVAGSLIMVLTGLMLYYPAAVAWILPGQLIPVAKVAHSNEGLMATLVIIVWHIYNAHLNPDVFPFDPSIFTGKISRERMEKEHPLELERLEEAEREGRANKPGG
jgi:cytochrome b subunit of formate dehydrogenase